MSKYSYSRAMREAAEKIPDEFFADHPKIVALRVDLAAAEAKHVQTVARHSQFARDTEALQGLATTTRGDIASREGSLQALAVDAFQGGDLTFAAVVVTKAEIQKLAWQLEGIELALQDAKAKEGGGSGNRRASEATAFRISDLTSEISQLLIELKLEHARAAA